MSVFLLGANPTVADAEAKFPLGTEIADPRTRDVPGNIIRYIKAGGTIAASAAVRQDYTATDEPYTYLATSATGQIVQGVAIVALSSSVTSGNTHGWITVKGKQNVLTLAVAATGTFLCTTATAGTLDDLATNTDFTAVAIAAMAGVPVVSADSTAATDGVLECFIG